MTATLRCGRSGGIRCSTRQPMRHSHGPPPNALVAPPDYNHTGLTTLDHDESCIWVRTWLFPGQILHLGRLFLWCDIKPALHD
jgi:hypothetical protein